MSQSQILEVTSSDWNGQELPVSRQLLLEVLESGKVLYFPKLNFTLQDNEAPLLDPAIADPKRKNISLAASGGVLHGVLADDKQQPVRELVGRFQQQACALVDGLFPEYRQRLRTAPTSLRLMQVEGRQTSWRKDDSRLHIDAFPSRPNYGERILRVFTNVNPSGAPRVWRVGEPFEQMAKRFLPRIKSPFPGSARLLHWLHITKSPRSRYDHLMLNLHDAMKADMEYQRSCDQETMPFPQGAVWICFSDQTSHAVMSGQHMLEQTFFLPVTAMAKPEWAPLGILQRLQGRALV